MGPILFGQQLLAKNSYVALKGLPPFLPRPPDPASSPISFFLIHVAWRVKIGKISALICKQYVLFDSSGRPLNGLVLCLQGDKQDRRRGDLAWHAQMRGLLIASET
jgi:hypothetical protein